MTSARFRYPRTAYLAVGFFAICLLPMVRNWWLTLLLLIPAGFAWFVARTGTDASPDGVTVRTMLGTEHVEWTQIAGLRVGHHNELYAVMGDQQLRLPAARYSDLPKLTQISEEAAG